HGPVDRIWHNVRPRRLRLDPRGVEDAAQVRSGPVADQDLRVEPLPEPEHQAGVEVALHAFDVVQLLVRDRDRVTDLPDRRALLGEDERGFRILPGLGDLGGRMRAGRLLHVDDRGLARPAARDDVDHLERPGRRLDDDPRPGRLRRPARAGLEQRRADLAEAEVLDFAGARIPRLPVLLEGGRVDDHRAGRLGLAILRVDDAAAGGQVDVARDAVLDLLDLRELLALVVERLDLLVALADLLDRLGAILRAEQVQDLWLVEVEVRAGRLEDVGQGLALGVELLALRDELGQGAGHVAPSWLCAEGPSERKDGQTRRGLRRVLAVGGSNFDRGRAVPKCLLLIYAAFVPRARAASRCSRATNTFTRPQLLQSLRSRGAATRASVPWPTCSM